MIHNLPKAELHCHIEGAATPELVLQQADKYQVDATPYIDPVRGYIWNDFTSFLKSYDFAASLFRTPEDYILMTETHFKNIARQNAIYGEIFASPDHAARIGCSYNTLIEALSEGIRLANITSGIEGRIVVTGVRHVGIEAVENAAKLAVENPHPLVTGFGMAGDERVGKASDFAYAFDIARDGGLGLTVHAGEFGGPDNVRDALDHLKVSRIGHGVRSIENADLVRRLAEEQITLEICPASNIVLQLYADLSQHPFSALEQAGCVVTLSSDDPPHFHSSLEHEYEIACNSFGYDNHALLSFTRNSINAAFVDGDTRKRLLEKCIIRGLN